MIQTVDRQLAAKQSPVSLPGLQVIRFPQSDRQQAKSVLEKINAGAAKQQEEWTLKTSGSEMKNNREMDMLSGSIFRKLCAIAIPICLSSILQQLFNASDTAVVGNFSSSQAMAAVGTNAPVINVIVTFFSGLSIGSNVMLSSFIGSGNRDKVNEALHTSFMVALISGLLMLVLGQVIAQPVLTLLGTPEDVMGMAVTYLRIYFLGMPFLMIYDFGSSILRAIGDTRRPLLYLTCSGILNVFLNLFFVIVLHRNADGVAIATTISNAVSAFLILRALIREKGMLHLELRHLQLKTPYLKKILWIGGPAGLQGMIFSVSNVVIQSAINHFGSACIAGNSAALNFEYISYFVVNGFAQAVMTFISQNYAAGNYVRCRKTTRTAMLCSVGFCAMVSVSFFLLKAPLLHLFSQQPDVLRYAYVRMTFITLLEPMTASYEITGASLRGIGHSMAPALITLFGCCGLRVAFIGAMLQRFTSFYQVVLIYPVTWIVTGSAIIAMYFIVTRKEYIITAIH
jgi:putative MATE family efflux protein